MKKYFYLFLITMFLFPFLVNARTLEEANELLNSFDDEITIKGVNPESLNYMTDENQWFYRSAVLKFHLLKNPNEQLKKILSYEDDLEYEVIDNGNTLRLKTWYNGESGDAIDVTKNISLKYADLDANEFSKAKKITDSLEYYYSLGGMNSINSLYHYGYISDKVSDMIARFPELKKIIEKYKEYDVEIILDRGGGTPNWEERYAYVGFYKNNILYSFKEILLHIDEVVFVDKDKEGSLAKRAKDRLNDYFKGNVNISVDENVVDWMDEHADFEMFKEEYKSINVYSIVSTNITIGDKQFFMMIVETDSNGIDKMYVESSDKETGVNIQTESYDVPVDAIVKVKDVSGEEYVKKAVEDNNMKIIKVYDIDLERYSDKKLVKDIKNGLDIYIPIEEATEGDEITVYYINSDGEIAEEIKGFVVKQDNKLFVKFTTNHLSTYALLEKEEEVNNSTEEVTTGDKEEVKEVTSVTNETSEKETSVPLVDNPQTGDNIMTYVILLALSIIGLIGSVFYYRRKKYN